MPDRESDSKTAMVCLVVHAAMHKDEAGAYQLIEAIEKIE